MCIYVCMYICTHIHVLHVRDALHMYVHIHREGCKWGGLGVGVRDGIEYSLI